MAAALVAVAVETACHQRPLQARPGCRTVVSHRCHEGVRYRIVYVRSGVVEIVLIIVDEEIVETAAASAVVSDA